MRIILDFIALWYEKDFLVEEGYSLMHRTLPDAQLTPNANSFSFYGQANEYKINGSTPGGRILGIIEDVMGWELFTLE